jgi:hypothetical protein
MLVYYKLDTRYGLTMPRVRPDPGSRTTPLSGFVNHEQRSMFERPSRLPERRAPALIFL